MISTAKITNCGGRQQNEDTVKIEEGQLGICAVVADGLGGHGGGQIASGVAAQVITQAYQEGRLTDKAGFWQVIRQADASVKEHQTKACAMKTTVVILTIQKDTAIWAHVGDSRLYHFRNGSLVHQTMDHSVSQVAVLMGEITPDQIRFHEDRNRVLRALGSENCDPEVAAPLALGTEQHAFLMCTDGFWEYVYEEEMEACLRETATPEEWIRKMEMLLKSRVTQDNDNYTAAAVFYQQ